MEDHPVLRPGQQTDVVMDVDESTESIDVRQSLIYDVVGEEVTLSQTARPLSRHDFQKKVLITVLSRRDDRPVRYAVPVRVSDLLNDYRLASNKSVIAVTMDIAGDHFEYNLRMHYRIRPDLNSGLEMMVQGNQVSIFDISIGGAKVLANDNFSLNPGTIAGATLKIDGKRYELRIQVLRTWKQSAPGSSRRSDSLFFAMVRFLSVNREAERHLAQKVREIERIQRQQELDLRTERDREGQAS